jgi:UDP-glucose 6-dehydrogenase
MKTVIAGTSYTGLSDAVFLSQYYKVFHPWYHP